MHALGANIYAPARACVYIKAIDSLHHDLTPLY